MRACIVRVVLDPMLEQVFMTRKDGSHMVRLKQGHVALPQLDSLILNVIAPMRARRERCVMAEDDYVNVPASVESFKLPLRPLVLLLIPCDVGVESNNKRVPVPAGICSIAFQPSRRTFTGD